MSHSADRQQGPNETGVSRRTFGLSAAAIASAGALPAQATVEVVETAVDVKTPDGMADGFLLRPAGKGTYPAVLFWPDGFGLRRVLVDMGRRLAAQGYVVLVPNHFYRSGRAPVIKPGFDFNDPEARAKFMAIRALMPDPAIDSDARAYLAYLDAQPQTDKSKKAGVQGYCMGGALSFRTAAAVPDRIGAVGSFHGGGLVTDQPSSPHLLIPKTRASYLVAVAKNDDAKEPDAKTALKAAFAQAGRPATVEVYPADHGWCVSDSHVYSEPAAEKAWAELSALYKKTLT